MTLALVPIPLDCLEGTAGYWQPYILAIAERSRNDPDAMTQMLLAGEAQAFLIWEVDTRKTQAFLGVRYAARGQTRIGELIWLMGENRAAWAHLFAELETYLREHQGCKAIKAIARPGWSKHLKSNGYRLTHQVMEKEFSS
jgi:hypothetical protein